MTRLNEDNFLSYFLEMNPLARKKAFVFAKKKLNVSEEQFDDICNVVEKELKNALKNKENKEFEQNNVMGTIKAACMEQFQLDISVIDNVLKIFESEELKKEEGLEIGSGNTAASGSNTASHALTEPSSPKNMDVLTERAAATVAAVAAEQLPKNRWFTPIKWGRKAGEALFTNSFTKNPKVPLVAKIILAPAIFGAQIFKFGYKYGTPKVIQDPINAGASVLSDKVVPQIEKVTKDFIEKQVDTFFDGVVNVYLGTTIAAAFISLLISLKSAKVYEKNIMLSNGIIAYRPVLQLKYLFIFNVDVPVYKKFFGYILWLIYAGHVFSVVFIISKSIVYGVIILWAKITFKGIGGVQ